MTFSKALAAVRFVVDSNGERTDVLIPLDAWKELLASWKRLVEDLEDQEDATILRDWLERRAAGKTEMIGLDALEQEFLSGNDVQS